MSMESSRSVSLDTLKSRMRAFECLSLDVFDTAVVRSVAEPQEVLSSWSSRVSYDARVLQRSTSSWRAPRLTVGPAPLLNARERPTHARLDLRLL